MRSKLRIVLKHNINSWNIVNAQYIEWPMANGPIQAKQIEIGKMLSIKNDNKNNNNIADDDKSERSLQ